MKFKVGDVVEKTKGDYYFMGWVVAAFTKVNGAERYVVENQAGILHVYSEGNLDWVKEDVQST